MIIVNSILQDLFKEWKGQSLKMKAFQSFLFLFLIGCLITTGVSCVVSDPGVQYIKTNHEYTREIIPELIDYIKMDSKLSDLDKQTRIDSLRLWQRMNENKYRQLEEKEHGR